MSVDAVSRRERVAHRDHGKRFALLAASLAPVTRGEGSTSTDASNTCSSFARARCQALHASRTSRRASREPMRPVSERGASTWGGMFNSAWAR